MNRRAWTTMAACLREVDERCAHKGPVVDRYEIDEVRRCLDLPPPPHGELAAVDCWLAGGALLRWICGEPVNDYDFYFPDRAALHRTALRLIRIGCTVRRASHLRHVSAHSRHKLRVLANRLRGRPHPAAPPAFERWDGPGATRWVDEVALARWLLVLELVTPAGDKLQLVGAIVRPTPVEMLTTFDYSICRLAMDDRYLYVGRRTLTDLADRRLRLERLTHPTLTLRRLLKYLRRGFYPDHQTLAEVARAFRHPRAPLLQG